MNFTTKKKQLKETTKQSLIHTYVKIIKDMHKSIDLSYNEYVKQIKLNFNYDVTLEDIRLYFEPNVQEDVLDLRLQLSNLGIMYE